MHPVALDAQPALVAIRARTHRHARPARSSTSTCCLVRRRVGRPQRRCRAELRRRNERTGRRERCTARGRGRAWCRRLHVDARQHQRRWVESCAYDWPCEGRVRLRQIRNHERQMRYAHRWRQSRQSGRCGVACSRRRVCCHGHVVGLADAYGRRWAGELQRMRFCHPVAAVSAAAPRRRPASIHGALLLVVVHLVNRRRRALALRGGAQNACGRAKSWACPSHGRVDQHRGRRWRRSCGREGRKEG